MYWCTQNCISTLAEPEILPPITGNSPCPHPALSSGLAWKTAIKGDYSSRRRPQTVGTLKAPAPGRPQPSHLLCSPKDAMIETTILRTFITHASLTCLHSEAC